MSGITGIDGLASGIQTTEIVDAMISAARNATRVQEQRKELLSARLEAVQGFNTRMLGAQLDLTSLRSGGAFNNMAASSSNPNVMSARANSSAVPGSYSFEVTRLAQAHQIATSGQVSQSSNIGAGSIQLQLGSGSPVEIELSADNSSLANIAQAINNAQAGVSAYVVQQEGANPYRLILQSQETGLSSEISISATGALEDLFSDMTSITDAQDAELKMGSGAGAMTFSSSSNEFKNVIPGVTLDAHSLGTSTLTVSRDSAGAREDILSFVESLNGAIDYLRANTQVDPEGKDSGILLSQTGLRRDLDSVIRGLFSAIPGLPQDMNNVTSIGLGIDRQTGRITVDESVLSQRLASNPAGVAKLFGNSGESSEPGITFASMSSETDPSQPFSVHITQAASQAQTSGVDLAEEVIIDSSNRGFSLSINNRTYAMTLAEGSYTRESLVSHLQAVLDEQTSLQDKVHVGLDGNALTLNTQRYGSSSSLNVAASSANDLFGFAQGLRSGTDVAGTINGEAATGSGQILTGNTGSAQGLSLVVSAGGPVNATMTVTEGLGRRLGTRFSSLTDRMTGSITQTENSLSSSISNIEEQIRKVDARLEVRREGLLRQFRTMEQLIGNMQSQQGFLEGAINSWNNLSQSVSSRRR